MTETTQADARAQDFPEEDREPSVGNCSPLESEADGSLGRCQLPLKERKKHVEKIQRRIERARQLGHTRQARRLTKLLLRSYDCRLVATVDANRCFKRDRRQPDDELPRIAASLHPWKGSDEPVTVDIKPKRPRGWRPIMRFGLQHKALQTQLQMVLEPHFDPDPSQYGVSKGKGREKACARVLEIIRKEEYKWVVSTDIRDCFLSFDAEKTVDLLPVPNKPAEKIAVSRGLNLTIGQWPSTEVGPLSLLTRSQQGIPPGSRASNMVAEIGLSPSLRQLPEEHPRVTYSDNTLVFTRTKKEAEAVAETLRRAFAHNPAGSFRPGYIKVGRVCNWFEFLGYRFIRRIGCITAEPTEKNWRHFCYKLREKVRRRNGIHHARRYVHDWYRSFGLRDSWERRRDGLLRQLPKLREEEIEYRRRRSRRHGRSRR